MSISTQPLTVAGYVTRQIHLSGKPQKQIAREAGFATGNMITMIKLGQTKIPINRVPALAKAIGADQAHLLRLVLGEYEAGVAAIVEDALGPLVTVNERKILDAVRAVSLNTDPEIGSARQRELLQEAFQPK